MHAFFALNVFYNSFKRVYIVFVGGFHAENHIAVHLHETSV